MALKKQVTLTQHGNFEYGKASHSDDSEGEQQEQNGAHRRQQGDPEGPPANDAADNDGGEGGNENYELSQEDFDELTQQFGDHSHYMYDDGDDDAEEQDADADVERGTNLPRTECGDLNEKEIVKLEGDKPAKTLTKSNRMQHYKHKSRGLTIRELARLQSFPDTFFFAGDVQAQRDQIGNAVPCMLAEAIGRFILRSYVPEDEKNTEE